MKSFSLIFLPHHDLKIAHFNGMTRVTFDLPDFPELTFPTLPPDSDEALEMQMSLAGQQLSLLIEI